MTEEIGQDELDEIVRTSTDRAEALFPPKRTSPLVKVVQVAGSVLLIFTIVLSLVNTVLVQRTNACQKTYSARSVVIASDDRAAVDAVLNGTNKLQTETEAAIKKNPADIVQIQKASQVKFKALLDNYNLQRKANDKKRAALVAKGC